MPGFYIPSDGPIDQGDILGLELPSLKVTDSPLKAAEYWKPGHEGRELWTVHGPDVPPKGGFRWSSHEKPRPVLAHGNVGLAIVLSHECEIENDPNVRVLALIRPMTDLSEGRREETRTGDNNCTFYLPADGEIGIRDECFVDFRRLTIFHPDVLPGFTRVTRLAEVVRKALAKEFWDFLFRRVIPDPSRSEPRQ